MAKAYIANRPVRFDRNYRVGEIIPDDVISPQTARRLTEMGRILCVDLPDADLSANHPPNSAAPPANVGEANPDSAGGKKQSRKEQKEIEETA